MRRLAARVVARERVTSVRARETVMAVVSMRAGHVRSGRRAGDRRSGGVVSVQARPNVHASKRSPAKAPIRTFARWFREHSGHAAVISGHAAVIREAAGSEHVARLDGTHLGFPNTKLRGVRAQIPMNHSGSNSQSARALLCAISRNANVGVRSCRGPTAAVVAVMTNAHTSSARCARITCRRRPARSGQLSPRLRLSRVPDFMQPT